MSATITCKQAVIYISKKEEGKLTAAQRFRLWRHLTQCSLCRIFSSQNKIISRLAKNKPSEELTDADKEKIVSVALSSGE
jgi:hypothetical protein